MSALPSSSTAALYTRSALLQWANRSLSTSYATLDAVPAMHVALLLNAIHGHNSFPLNRIDFSAPITTGTAGSSVSSAARAAHLRNCEVVLSQARSHLGYEGRLSPSLWLAKEDTANELLFWRWIRQSAEGRGWAGSINAEGLMKSVSVTSGNFFASSSSSTTAGGMMQQQQQAQTTSSSTYAEAFRVDNFLSPTTDDESSHKIASSSAVNTSSTMPRDESAQPARSKGPRVEGEAAFIPSSSSLTSSIGRAVAHHSSSAAATITPTPTPQHISQQNATYLQKTASSVPIGREAEAYHASLAMLTNHLHQQQNQQRQQMLMQQQQQQYEVNTTDMLALGTVPTDPYMAAIIDAKNEKLQFLRSIRARLIAACHAKDRSKVAELMCEYIRGGPSAQQQVASSAVDRMLI